MSLYGALFSGVSGLAAQSSAMGAISDNISNVNTIGYKGSKVNFQTLVTKQVSLTNYSPGGVQSKPRHGVDVQGLLQATNSSTDVALSGQGFFIVNEAAKPADGDMFAYTRAGSFKVDKEGYMQNVSGWYMQGWPLMAWDNAAQASTVTIGNNVYMKAYKDDIGDTVYINDNIVDETHLQALNLNEVGGTASQTRNLRMGANLPNGAAVGKIIRQPVTIYDSLGGDNTLQFGWEKTAQNRWSVEAYPPAGAKSLLLKNTAGGIYAGMGRLDFSGLPTDSGVVTMNINGVAHDFDFTGNATADYNTHDLLPSAAGSTGAWVSNLATEIQKAYNIEYDSTSFTPAGYNGAQDNIAINGTNIDLSAATDIDTAITAINAQATTTGVYATKNGTAMVLYSANQGTMQIGGAGNFAGLSTNVTFATGGITFPLATATDSLTIGGTAINIDTDANITDLAASINAQASTTHVWAEVSGANLVLYSDSATNVTIAGTGDLAGIGTPVVGTTFSTSGTTYAERLEGTNSLIFRQTDPANDLVVSGLDSIDLSNGNPATLQGMDPTYPDTFTINHLTVVDDAIEFNGDGTPKEINVASIAIDWANGSTDMTGSNEIGAFLGNLNIKDGMTQLDGDYQLAYWSQNGAKFGNFAGVSIGADGIVTALFDNGVTRPVFQIPVATFVNPNGMDSVTGNVFISTDNSGEPTLRSAGSAGAGSVSSASLEASTVDIGEEFTTMIVTQRAYSAAAKIITTADEMLDELVRIKR